MISAKTVPTVFRVLWIAVFVISSIWFSYWIYYDISVWGKALNQIALQNYLGLILSIVLIVLSTQFGRFGISWKLMRLTKSVQDKLTKETQVQPVERQRVETEQIQSSMDVEHEQIPPVEEPVKAEAIQVPEGSSVPPGCRFYLGYLHRRQKSVDIPEECLECGHVVDCLSPSVRTMEEDSHNPEYSA